LGESHDHQETVGQKGVWRVTFELPSTMWAERVKLVGEFNDWDTLATPMTHNRSDATESGHRAAGRQTLPLSLPGDGKEWLDDWHADDYVENPYGSYDSVVDVDRVRRATALLSHALRRH